MRPRTVSLVLALFIFSVPILAAERGGSTITIGSDQLEVLSWSYGVTQTATAGSGSGGAGAGKVQMQDFHFVIKTGKSSATLFRACATGQHIPEVKLVARDAKGKDYYVVTLKDVLVSSFHTGGANSDELPTDRVSLNYASVEFQVLGQ